MSTPCCVSVSGRHEDDEEHEQHVDERRDVHVRAGVRDLALDDLVGAEMVMCVRHYCPPAAPPRLSLGDEADVLDAGLPQLVHRRHHRAVLDFLVGLDEDDLLLLVLEHLVDLRRQLGFGRPAWRSGRPTLSLRDGDRPSCPASSGLSTRVGRRRQLDGDALLAASARRAS